MQHHRVSISLADLAQSEIVALLETRDVTHTGVQQVVLPKEKKILYVAETLHAPLPSLLPLLQATNQVEISSLSQLKSKEDGLFWYHPPHEERKPPYEVLLLPDGLFVGAPSDEIPTVSPPIVIRYEVSPKRRIPVTLRPGQLGQKKLALLQHHSQIARTAYDRIVEEMGESVRSTWTHDQPAEAYRVGKGNLDAMQSTSLHFVPAETYGEEKLLRLIGASTILAVGAHPDDVELGMGGFIQTLAAQDQPVTVLNATSGYRSQMYKEDFVPYLEGYLPFRRDKIKALPEGEITDPATKKWIRATESEAAIRLLHSSAQILHADLPFYTAPAYKLTEADHAKIAELVPAPQSGGLCLFLSHPQDQHPAHRVTTKLFLEYANALEKNGTSVCVLFYDTPWTGDWNLFHYTPDQGSRLGALVGLEQLAGKGHKSLRLEEMASDTAQRYRVEEIGTER